MSTHSLDLLPEEIEEVALFSFSELGKNDGGKDRGEKD